MAFALFIRAISKLRGLISKGVLVIEPRIKRIWRMAFALFIRAISVIRGLISKGVLVI